MGIWAANPAGVHKPRRLQERDLEQTCHRCLCIPRRPQSWGVDRRCACSQCTVSARSVPSQCVGSVQWMRRQCTVRAPVRAPVSTPVSTRCVQSVYKSQTSALCITVFKQRGRAKSVGCATQKKCWSCRVPQWCHVVTDCHSCLKGKKKNRPSASAPMPSPCGMPSWCAGVSHNCICHHYIGHPYHNYIGHNYIGHHYIGHARSAHGVLG